MNSPATSYESNWQLSETGVRMFLKSSKPRVSVEIDERIFLPEWSLCLSSFVILRLDSFGWPFVTRGMFDPLHLREQSPLSSICRPPSDFPTRLRLLFSQSSGWNQFVFHLLAWK